MWQEPLDLETEICFTGQVDPARARDTNFRFVARDTSGWSQGFDVTDANGGEWSVKLGLEAQTEVVTSRILWAIGFHQPPTYYLERWSLTGAGTSPSRRGDSVPSCRTIGCRRLVLVRESVRRFANRTADRGGQPPPEQLGLEDVQQQDLRAIEAGGRREAAVRRARSGRVAGPNHVPASADSGFD